MLRIQHYVRFAVYTQTDTSDVYVLDKKGPPGNNNVTPLEDFVSENVEVQLRVVHDSGEEPRILRAARFEHAHHGCRLWISVADLYRAAGLSGLGGEEIL